MALEYRERRPHPALADRVECCWSLTDDGQPSDQPGPHRVVPDGCMDLVCLPGAAGGVRLTVVGTMTRAMLVPRGTLPAVAGIRFRPGAAPALLDTPAGELTDRRISARELAAGFKMLDERLADRSDPWGRLSILEGYLLERGPEDTHPAPADFTRAVTVASREEGRISVAALARKVGVSRRTLERRFHRWVGVPPKTACRVLRFRRAVELLLAGRRDGSRVARAAGYYDQAHFIRDFRRLAGVTPTEFVRERSRVAFVQDESPGHRQLPPEVRGRGSDPEICNPRIPKP